MYFVVLDDTDELVFEVKDSHADVCDECNRILTDCGCPECRIDRCNGCEGSYL